MNEFLSMLILCDSHEIESKLPKEKVLRRLKDVTDPKGNDYHGYVHGDSFLIQQKSNRLLAADTAMRRGVRIAASGKVTECDGITKISFVIRFDALTYVGIAFLMFALLLAGSSELVFSGIEGISSGIRVLISTLIFVPVIQLITRIVLKSKGKRILRILEPLFVYDDEHDGTPTPPIFSTLE